MAELEKTPNLGIPRILGNQPLVRQQFNGAIDELDKQALSVNHAATKAHFELWKANTTYKIQDIVKTSTCPSWGFYMCNVSGTSGTTEPVGYGEGDLITDGSCTWVLRMIGGATSIKHGDLTLRNLADQHTMEAITGLIETLGNKASIDDVRTAINDIIDGAPGAYDTLKEIADYIAQDQTATAAILSALNNKVEKIEGKGLSTNDYDNTAKNKVDKISEINSKFAYDNKVITGGAPDWVSGNSYNKDELVIRSSILYRCLQNHTSTTFEDDSSKWESVSSSSSSVGIEEMTYNKVTNTLDVTLTDGTKQSFSDLGQNFYGGFQQFTLWSGSVNTVGKITLSDSISNYDFLGISTTTKFYITPVSKPIFWLHTFYSNGTFSACFGGDVSGTTLNITTANIATGSVPQYITGVIGLKGNGNINSTAPDWKTGITYLVNQMVIYNGAIYRCITSHTSTDFQSDISKWQSLSTSDNGNGGNIENVLFSGAIGSDTNTSSESTTIALTDSVYDYDEFRLHYSEYSNTGQSIRHKTYTVSVEDYQTIINLGGYHNILVGSVDSTGATSLSIKNTSTSTSIAIAYLKSIVTKVVGIKKGDLQAKDWEANKSYVQNQLIVNNGSIYRCNTSHTSSSTSFTDDKSNWTIVCNGVSDVSYNNATSQLNFTMADGSSKQVGNVSANFYGGFDQVTLFSGSVNGATNGGVTSANYANLSGVITNYDYIQVSGLIKGRPYQILLDSSIIVRRSPYVVCSYVGSGTYATGSIYFLETDSVVYMDWIGGAGWTGDSTITKVIGLKGRTNKETVLWSGSVGTSSSSYVTGTIALTDKISNYKRVRVSCNMLMGTEVRPQSREFNSSDFTDSLTASTTYMSVCWGHSSNSDFVNVRPTDSKLTSLTYFACYGYLKSIVGIN